MRFRFGFDPVLRVLSVLLLGGTLAAVATGRESKNAASAITITQPLPDLLQRGTAAFAAGDYATAASVFGDIERDYGAEPAWTNGTLPKKLLPLRGFAELQAGLPTEAADSLAAFLEQFPDDASQRSFVLYALALALRENGKFEEALKRFDEFETENKGSAQAALAGFQRAEILFKLDRSDDALGVLGTLAESAPTESLQTQARLRALQKAVDLHRDELATQLLLESSWSVDTMPEIAVLAFAAMEIGDRALGAGHAAEAIRAYHFVLPREKLREAQRQRLAGLKARFEARAPQVAAGNGSFWIAFYRARIARIESELEGLENAPDYTAPLRLRVGQAYLLAGRPREAWLAFESLASNGSVSEDLRREAHYRWILAAADLESWDEALVIARAFTHAFPDANEAPNAFYLIARAHLETRDFEQAEAVLGDLLDRFPESPASARARFTRGWARVMQEHYAEARDDFDQYAADHPDGPLAVNAALWRALTYFFERHYPEALTALDALAAAHKDDPLYPEICYRRGTTLYAMRDYARAEAEMESFVRDYPAHTRHSEALVLLGDILMGAGNLDEARKRFAEIPPEATASYVYGVFQTGKILKAEKAYDEMVKHFSGYADRTDMPRQPRMSEALYWIGWAQERLGHPDAALPVYLSVLRRFGNDPGADDVGTTLVALEKLVRRIQMAAANETNPQLGESSTTDERQMTEDFDAWVKARRERARRDGELTLYARLTVFAADRHERHKEPYQAEALLLEIAGNVTPADLDAATLARVGLVLQNVGSPKSIEYFKCLLADYPSSFERAAAFYGLAAEASKDRKTIEALRWIDRFEDETPTHPLAPQVALLAGTTLEHNGQYDAASERFQNILRLKSARGRPHAEALMGLARCAIATGDLKRAIAYCQRVYTLHRAQSDLAAEAYLRSADLFERLGDLAGAAATYREMLSLSDVGDTSQRQRAERSLDAVQDRLPKEEPQPATHSPA